MACRKLINSRAPALPARLAPVVEEEGAIAHESLLSEDAGRYDLEIKQRQRCSSHKSQPRWKVRSFAVADFVD